jgi:hypothetical protein
MIMLPEKSVLAFMMEEEAEREGDGFHQQCFAPQGNINQ